MRTKILGDLAEEIAVDFLIKNNFKIIDRNWYLHRLGEIDIIACKKNLLNFVEVKSLRKNFNFKPEMHFNKQKFSKVEKLANFYANKFNYQKWIISLITVTFDKNCPLINYYENVKN